MPSGSPPRDTLATGYSNPAWPPRPSACALCPDRAAQLADSPGSSSGCARAGRSFSRAPVGSCSPPITTRTSIRGRSAFRSSRAAGCGSWPSRSSSGHRSAGSPTAPARSPCGAASGTPRRSRPPCDSAAPGTSSSCSRRTRRAKGLWKTREARAHTGAARIALEAGVPLVPAGIAGTDQLARLAALRVAYGSPVAIDDLRGGDQRRPRGGDRSSWPRSASSRRPCEQADRTAPARRRRRLVRPPGLPRAAEVDLACRRTAREPARRPRKHGVGALAGRAAAGVVGWGLARASHLSPRGVRGLPGRAGVRDALLEQLELAPEVLESFVCV